MMTDADLRIRGETACRIAREAGDMLARRRAEPDAMPYQVKGANDIVTALDRASEELISARLHDEFPDDDVFAEEDGLRRHGGNGRWVVDPIDGTENYVRGFPSYAVSIAYEDREGEPAVGVVYCPAKNELFHAVRGYGAWLNGARIRVSARDDARDAVTLVSPPFRRHDLADRYFALYKRVFLHTCDVRNTGSAALHCCYVAAGRAEGYIESSVYPFDIAAGLVIVSEAGGRWSALVGDSHPYQSENILVSNGRLHDWYRTAAREMLG
ncbi:MAG: inositol monophosphatase [Planctomycetes bacterium]|nr:inositol monophosphatase [Planctomycetota bacterium]